MAKGVRKRKHRWGTVKGRVISIRLMDDEYSEVGGHAEVAGVSVGEYVKGCVLYVMSRG